jgi:hypothetical protein
MTGEAGALSAPVSGKLSQAGYDQMMKEQQLMGFKKKDISNKKMEALSKSKEQDLKRWEIDAKAKKENIDQIINLIDKSQQFNEKERQILKEEVLRSAALGTTTSSNIARDALREEGDLQKAAMTAAARKKDNLPKLKLLPAKQAEALGVAFDIPDRISGLMEDIAKDPSLMGLKQSIRTDVSNIVGLDSPGATLQASIDSLRQDIGKLKEGGVLREHDEVKYKKMIPTLRTNPDVAIRNLKKIRTEMARLVKAKYDGSMAGRYDIEGFTPMYNEVLKFTGSGDGDGKKVIKIDEPVGEVISGKSEVELAPPGMSFEEFKKWKAGRK